MEYEVWNMEYGVRQMVRALGENNQMLLSSSNQSYLAVVYLKNLLKQFPRLRTEYCGMNEYELVQFILALSWSICFAFSQSQSHFKFDQPRPLSISPPNKVPRH
jgi:hypothetical protein